MSLLAPTDCCNVGTAQCWASFFRNKSETIEQTEQISSFSINFFIWADSLEESNCYRLREGVFTGLCLHERNQRSGL